MHGETVKLCFLFCLDSFLSFTSVCLFCHSVIALNSIYFTLPILMFCSYQYPYFFAINLCPMSDKQLTMVTDGTRYIL